MTQGKFINDTYYLTIHKAHKGEFFSVRSDTVESIKKRCGKLRVKIEDLNKILEIGYQDLDRLVAKKDYGKKSLYGADHDYNLLYYRISELAEASKHKQMTLGETEETKPSGLPDDRFEHQRQMLKEAVENQWGEKKALARHKQED